MYIKVMKIKSKIKRVRQMLRKVNLLRISQ